MLLFKNECTDSRSSFLALITFAYVVVRNEATADVLEECNCNYVTGGGVDLCGIIQEGMADLILN